MILAIDPGTEKSAYMIWDGAVTISWGTRPNAEMFSILRPSLKLTRKIVIEQIASYGMPVGAEVFETVFWSGRFAQFWQSEGGSFEMMPRKEVKMNLCQSARAKDSNIWQALVDRFGPVGTKKAPGLLYGVTSHERAALALAVTWWDQNDGSVKP